MVPFYEKRRVYVIQLSCGCCRTFIGGMFHQSCTSAHISVVPSFPRVHDSHQILSFHSTQTNPPQVTKLIEKDAFPLLLQSSQSQKPMCQHVLSGVFRISPWRWVLWRKLNKNGQQNFNTHVFHISSIHTLHILCNIMWPWPCIRYKNAGTIHKHKFNTPWTQSGIEYVTCFAPMLKINKSIWIGSDTFPTSTPVTPWMLTWWYSETLDIVWLPFVISTQRHPRADAPRIRLRTLHHPH